MLGFVDGGEKLSNLIEVKPGVAVDIDELQEFVYRAKKNTYATGGGKVEDSRLWVPGHKEHEYAEGDLYYRDSYAGYLSAPGRELVKIGGERGLAVWSMYYEGGMKPPYDILSEENVAFAKYCFGLLKNALANVPEDMPFRGPMIFRDEEHTDLIYHCHLMRSKFTRFSGYENIVKGSGFKITFEQNFGGGIIIYK